MNPLDLITNHLDVWTTAQTQKATGRGKKINNQSIHGIKKLRDLILELAVRGKLVIQDPNDHSTGMLIEMVAEEKAALTKIGKIRKPKKLPQIAEEDLPFILPVNWAVERLGNVSHVITKGTTPTSLGYAFVDSGVSFVKIENISRGRIQKYSISQFIEEKVNVALGRSQLEADDVLFSIAGTIGKTCIVHESDLPANTNQALAIIKGTSTVLDPRYLLIQLDSFVAEKTRSKARGGAMPNVSLGDLTTLVLPIPPLGEQHRIVAKVDELMTLCDQLEQQQTQSNATHQTLVKTLLATLTHPTTGADGTETNTIEIFFQHFDTLFTTEQSIDQLKQTILQLAVMGKLVPQNQQVKTSNLVSLNEQVKRERQLALMPKNTGKFEMSIFESPKLKFKVPGNWEIWPLANLALAIVDCPHSTPKWSDEGEICVRTNQLNPGLLDLSITRYVSSETYQKRVERLVPQGGDILYSREGGILGVACIIPSGVKLCLGQRMMLIRPPSFIQSRYLEMILNSPLINAIAREFTTGGAAPRVNLTTVKAYPIPLPPREEQHRIVAKVDKLMALCDALKAQFSGARATQFKLANTIGKQAAA